MNRCERCGKKLYHQDEGYIDEDTGDLCCYCCYNPHDIDYETMDDIEEIA